MREDTFDFGSSMRNPRIRALLAPAAVTLASSLAAAPAARADSATCRDEIKNAIALNAAAIESNTKGDAVAARQSNVAVERSLVNGVVDCVSESLPNVTGNLLGATVLNTGAMLANALTAPLNPTRAKSDAITAEQGVDAALRKALAGVRPAKKTRRARNR